jgi:hypothetical protein
MGLDIRTPIGLMFAIFGAILLAYGIATAGNGDLYQRSLGLNINAWWGAVLLVFGGVMLWLGRGAKAKG